MKALQDKVAVVTGAGRSRGIGRSIALELAARGATVVVTDVAKPRPDLNLLGRSTVAEDAGELEHVAEKIVSDGGRSLAMPVDVTVRSEIEECVARTVEAFGGIDIVVNNAGTMIGTAPFLELDDHPWEMNWKINVMGMVWLCRAAAPEMKRRGGGSIINMASVSGRRVSPGLSPYCTTKFAVVGLTKCLALDLGPFGIRANAVCPADVDTQMGDMAKALLDLPGESPEEVLEKSLEQVGLRRRATPEDIGRVVAWLAGPDAGFVNGAVVAVDGGLNEVLV
jgi:NAD(P)-dependent dehydrogenase (short-subunit alcohol dehydrogenase family)